MIAKGERSGAGKVMLAAGTLAIFIAAARSSSAFGWSVIDAKIRHDFPQVNRITITQLAAWLDDSARPAAVLLDVRASAEFEVSHLAAAERVDPDAPASAIHVPKDTPIVTYCSVGYRSGRFAQRLQKAGFTNVRNLEGSIFRWVNEGHPVYRGRDRVEKVHPYNATWGLLLQRRYRAEKKSLAP